MDSIETLTPEQAVRALHRFARAYREDATLRERIDTGDREAAVAHGLPLPPDITVKIVENTDTVFHLVMPPDPNAPLDEEALQAAAGGQTYNATLSYPAFCFSPYPQG